MRATRLSRRLLALAVGSLALADTGAMYIVSQAVKPLTVSQALAQYRAGLGSGGRAVTESLGRATPPTSAGPGAAPAAGPGGAPASSTPVPAAARSSSVPATGGASATAPGALSGAKTAAPDYSAIALAGPPPGVYVYDTQGSESVTALGGSTHQYPAQSTITDTQGGCGETIRWEPLQQRWDEYQLCNTAGGLAISTYTAFHEFFGQVDQRTYECSPGTYLDPVRHQTGYVFGGTCTSDGGAAVAQLAGRVLGTGAVTVEGNSVPAVHIRIDESLTGATKGSRFHDVWFALANEGLLVENTVTDCQTQTTFGYTSYHEQADLRLHSPTPLH